MSERFAHAPKQRELLELQSPAGQIVYLFVNCQDLWFKNKLLKFGLIEFAARGVYRVKALSALRLFNEIQRLATNPEEGEFVRFADWLETELHRNASALDLCESSAR